MKPFTQKHFGTKGASTDDTNSMTKGAATMMKQSAVMMYGSESPVKQRKKGESREDYGKRVYNQAMEKVKAQKENAAERKRKQAQEQRSTISYSMGMGTSRTSGKVKLPKVKTGMGTSYTTYKTKM